ncbi:hypothetical protein [Mesorhizobium sp.]|uniref:hypothetical protein n=1 Tax=Mesorhizobium sp. TaxID=1871066 RepID=UPI000FE7BF98|nr:hypothetical protein [Mesorhizobium sp.]RWE58386.1 MAG: hypothetical protein EOS67_13400 [Mesorhizobium sp.]
MPDKPANVERLQKTTPLRTYAQQGNFTAARVTACDRCGCVSRELAIAKESEVPDQSIFGGTATPLKGFTGVLISLDNLWSKIDLFYS